MNNIHIPSNIDNLSQILEDGLILCNESGLIISSNDVARQFLNKKLNIPTVCRALRVKRNCNEDRSLSASSMTT